MIYDLRRRPPSRFASPLNGAILNILAAPPLERKVEEKSLCGALPHTPPKGRRPLGTPSPLCERLSFYRRNFDVDLVVKIKPDGDIGRHIHRARFNRRAGFAHLGNIRRCHRVGTHGNRLRVSFDAINTCQRYTGR